MGRLYLAYSLVILLAMNAMTIADKMVLGVLQEPIRTEFGLSDFQLGLLGGPAFALLYTVMSIPAARIAEWGNRKAIIAGALSMFSCMTGLCGMAASFPQLLLARMGVSFGEGAITAPALSLITDYVSARRRATVMSIYGIGGPAGGLFAIVAGGWIAQSHGWRASFLGFGAAGLVLALIIALTIREVRHSPGRGAATPFREAVVWLAARRSFVHLCAGSAFSGLCAVFITQYSVSFFIRVHGLQLREAAAIVGFAGSGAGIIGTVLGGYIADRISERDPARRTLVAAAGFGIGGLAYAASFWAPLPIAIALYGFAAMAFFSYAGVTFAAAAGAAPPHMRATAIAFYALASNLIGSSLGPPLLGLLSDALSGVEMTRLGIDHALCAAQPLTQACVHASGEGLRRALTVAALLLLGGGWHFWAASRAAKREQPF